MTSLETAILAKGLKLEKEIAGILESMPDSVKKPTLELFQLQLKEAMDFLKRQEHTIAMVGAVGAGKTTALCGLLKLVNNGKQVLPTGSGRTTVCEMAVTLGTNWEVTLIPESEEETKLILEDLAEAIEDKSHNNTTDRDGISRELYRWMKNRLKLPKGKPEGTRAEWLANWNAAVKPEQDLKWEYDAEKDQCEPLPWIEALINKINLGIQEGIPIPKRICLEIPKWFVDTPATLKELEISIVDTKGLDEGATRTELNGHINNNRTLILITSGFNDAPEAAATAFLNRIKNMGLLQEIPRRTQLLVLDQHNQASKVTGDTGTVTNATEGKKVRSEQITHALAKSLRVPLDGPLPIHHYYNALSEPTTDTWEMIAYGILKLREQYTNQIQNIATAIENLDENNVNVETTNALSTVATAIHAWVHQQKEAPIELKEVHAPMLGKMQKTHHATVHATTRRAGTWDGFDVYEELNSSGRSQAAEQTTMQFEDLHQIIKTLASHPNCKAGQPYLEAIRFEANRAANEISLLAGQHAQDCFEGDWKHDKSHWTRQQNEWGRGNGYRQRVVENATGWLENHKPQESNLGLAANHRWQAFLEEIVNCFVRPLKVPAEPEPQPISGPAIIMEEPEPEFNEGDPSNWQPETWFDLPIDRDMLDDRIRKADEETGGTPTDETMTEARKSKENATATTPETEPVNPLHRLFQKLNPFTKHQEPKLPEAKGTTAREILEAIADDWKNWCESEKAQLKKEHAAEKAEIFQRHEQNIRMWNRDIDQYRNTIEEMQAEANAREIRELDVLGTIRVDLTTEIQKIEREETELLEKLEEIRRRTDQGEIKLKCDREIVKLWAPDNKTSTINNRLRNELYNTAHQVYADCHIRNIKPYLKGQTETIAMSVNPEILKKVKTFQLRRTKLERLKAELNDHGTRFLNIATYENAEKWVKHYLDALGRQGNYNDYRISDTTKDSIRSWDLIICWLEKNPRPPSEGLETSYRLTR